MSIDVDKANLSTESHKTLGITIFDLKLVDEAHIGTCKNYTEAYGLPHRAALPQ